MGSKQLAYLVQCQVAGNGLNPSASLWPWKNTNTYLHSDPGSLAVIVAWHSQTKDFRTEPKKRSLALVRLNAQRRDAGTYA